MAVGVKWDANGNEILLSRDIHPEVRKALNVRRVHPVAAPWNQVDIPVHPDVEFDRVNGQPGNQNQPTESQDEISLILHVIPTNCVNEIPATSPQINLPVLDDSDAVMNLGQQDQSSQNGQSEATALSSSHANVIDLSLGPRKPEEIQNPSQPEDGNRPKQPQLNDLRSGGELDHDETRPPDPATVSISPFKDAVTTAGVAAGGWASIPEQKMEDRTEPCSKSGAGSLEMALSSGRGKGKQRRSQTQTIPAPTKGEHPGESHRDYDRTLPTDFRIGDAPARKESEQKE